MEQTRRTFAKSIGALCVGLPFLGSEVIGSKESNVDDVLKSDDDFDERKKMFINEMKSYMKSLNLTDKDKIDYESFWDFTLKVDKKYGVL